MKNYLKICILIIILIAGNNLLAQNNYKFGHINSQELISLMPETDGAQAILEAFVLKLQDQLEAMQVEYNKKLQDYLAERDNLTDLIRQTKEQDLNDLQQRMQGFEANAQQDMQRKQTEVMQPIAEKAQNAIKEVARENNFTYIFDLAGGVIIYFSEDSEDVLPMVKSKLGITE